MKQATKIQSAIRMFDTFLDSSAPFDIVMSKYFRNNKWIGSHERREIAEFCYLIFRNYEKLRYLIDQYLDSLHESSMNTENISMSRFLVIGCLSFIENLSPKAIENLFSGNVARSEPSKLSSIEANFIDKSKHQKTGIKLPKYAELNYPLWIEPYLKRAFGEEKLTEEMSALNSKTLVNLRVNTLKTSREELLKNTTDISLSPTKFSENGLEVVEGRISRNHPIIKDGLAEIQDEGSQLIAEVCCALSKETDMRTVVDFCAGAGGKTLAIAAFMKNKGRIFALDKYSERLENAKARFKRAGVNNVVCQEICGKWLKRHKECADVVLVDSPCSGTGTWRRNPDMRAKFKKEDLEELVKVQAEILESAGPLVKKGGYLVYSTCSILLEENDDQIKHFLEKFVNFKHQKVQLPQQKELNGDFLRLSPFKSGTDGFFAAVMKREE